MKKIMSIGVVLTAILFACTSEDWSTANLRRSEQQLTPLLELSMQQNKIPKSIHEDNSVKWIGDKYEWTEGFWSGTCWLLYAYTKDEKWKEGALASQALFLAHKDLTHDHDIGFIFNDSYGLAYKITGEQKYKQVLIDAAEALSTRFNAKVGCTQSWDVTAKNEKKGWKFPVIIDNIMNLELLFEASRLTGDEKYKNIAMAHANTTMANHFRADGSSYHLVDYDPETGDVRRRMTVQGYADDSAWARGQAWGLYGYTMCYRYTKDPRYLAFAGKIADFILNHKNFPADGVPYWDFDAPDIPNAMRDASSAAIIASALLELSDYTEKKYTDEARQILTSLSSDDYFARPGENGHFVLKHSVGSIPGSSNVDVPMNYADYYYIEALLRLKKKNL